MAMRYIQDNNNDNKNLLSFRTQDGHGGRAEQHREEMKTIARAVYEEEKEKTIEEIKEIMYETIYDAYRQAINDFLGALEYDVESVTRIGFDGCRDIFEDKRAQKFISDHIMKEIEKRLNGKNFRK